MNSSDTNPISSESRRLRDDAAVRVETHLLTASGVFAIWLVAVVAGLESGFWPQTVLYAAFTVVFVSLTNRNRIGLGNRMEVLGVLVLLLLSVWSWFLTPTGTTLILTVVMMARAPYVLAKRQCWFLLLFTNGAFWVVFTFYWDANNLLLSLISIFVLQAFAFTSSSARVKEAQMKQLLFAQNAELIEARSALAEKSQMEERLRIAGDLHDSIGHQLTALRLQLEALLQLAPGELKPRIEVSQQLSLDLLENIRSIVKRMSREEAKDLPALVRLIDGDTPGVDITLQGSIPEMDSALQQQLVPCIKEGLSNAIRHSNAKNIKIMFEANSLIIEDDGAGVAEASEFGFGLKNIKQRLAPFGAEVALSNLQAGACRLTITLASGFTKEVKN